MTGNGTSPTRALVLGGGGVAGIAWEVGVLVGLAEAGVDVGAADRIVGTSAGSVVGALVATGVDLASVHAEHQMAVSPGPPVTFDMDAMGAALAAAVAGASDAREVRARIGAWASSVDTASETDRREIIAGRLPVRDWPSVDLRITAVDAVSGDRVVFTAAGAGGSDGPLSTGVGLVDAVAASCAVPGVWPPVTIGAHRYMDGGMASIVHVELADEPDPVDRVLVLAPLDPVEGGPFASASGEIARRRAERPDSPVLGVLADESSLAAFGANVLDPAVAPASARAGRVQGLAVAADVARLWA